MRQVEIPAGNVFRKLCKSKILSNSNDGNGAWRTEKRAATQSHSGAQKSSESSKKKSTKKQPVCELKSGAVRSERSPSLQSTPLMNGCTPAPLRKTHSPVHTHKTPLNTHTLGVRTHTHTHTHSHTHREFSRELSGVEVLRGRAGRNNGLNSRGERERVCEREGESVCV